jgi:hypothetical protein
LTGRLSALRTAAWLIGIFDDNCDLTLELEYRSVGILENVHLLDGHQISGVFDIVHQILVNGATLIGDQIETVIIAINNKARVHGHTERVHCIRITSPFVEHALSDDRKAHRLTSGRVEDFVSTHRHGYDLCLEAGGDFADFDARAHGLVRLHVEALYGNGTIDFRHEARME